MNLILAGYRGCGKTTVGEVLARKMGWHFVDLDDLISRKAGKTIVEIFATEGEEGFRRREREACEQLRKSKNQVIALGGGTLINSDCRALLKRVGKVIWLRAPAAVLWARISRDGATAHGRPDLTQDGGLAEVENLLREREPIYKAAALHIIDSVNDSPEEIAEAIEMWFEADDSDAVPDASS